MKLPGALLASVPERKITGYLLSPTHRAGRGKEKFFSAHGYRVDAWNVLAEALLEHVRTNDLVETERTPYGVRYVIEGDMIAPDGTKLLVRSVWFIENKATEPRFVTAYPGRRRRP